jgi:hypothetical protein
MQVFHNGRELVSVATPMAAPAADRPTGPSRAVKWFLAYRSSSQQTPFSLHEELLAVIVKHE